MSHTPEPWLARDWRILPVNYVLTGAPVATVHARKKHGMQTANARRIVACVNACEGISTETLEQTQTISTIELCDPAVDHIALKQVYEAAPDLLQELRNIANADTTEWDDRSEFEVWAKSRARAAIAKVEGN